jgi:hypothetical protein
MPDYVNSAPRSMPGVVAGARLAVKALRIGLAHVACETGGRESAE